MLLKVAGISGFVLLVIFRNGNVFIPLYLSGRHNNIRDT